MPPSDETGLPAAIEAEIRRAFQECSTHDGKRGSRVLATSKISVLTSRLREPGTGEDEVLRWLTAAGLPPDKGRITVDQL